MELFYSTFSSGKMSLDARSLVEEGFVRYAIMSNGYSHGDSCINKRKKEVATRRAG